MKIVAKYIISAQETYKLFEGEKNIELSNYTDNYLTAKEPNLRDLIPMNQLRRMGKAVRIGTGAGLKLIANHPEFSDADAIILTTANGGLEDCIKFLKQIHQFKDGSLTPTNFVQSTPNAIAGSIALATRNHSYNMTHVCSSFSLIEGLRDAQMLLAEHSEAKILLGSVEEISSYNYRINTLKGLYKKEMIHSNNLIKSKTEGTICGEGATFFGLVQGDNQSGMEIISFNSLYASNKEEIHSFLKHFITSDSYKENIDTLFLGFNGDIKTDHYYNFVMNELLNNTNVFTFKELFGEHESVCALALGYATLLAEGTPPLNEPLRLIHANKKPKDILIYNHYRGIEHSIIRIKHTP